jgi:hypothetical protein
MAGGIVSPDNRPWKGSTMTGVDAIRTALQSTQQLTNWFISDLSDSDLLVRPATGANHIAWQMGPFHHHRDPADQSAGVQGRVSGTARRVRQAAQQGDAGE